MKNTRKSTHYSLFRVFFVCFSAGTLGLPSIFNNFIADVKARRKNRR